VGEVPGIAAGEVDETGSGHLRRQRGALGVLPVEHLERHSLDAHGGVVRSAEVDPVPNPFRAFLRGGRRKQDGPLRAPREQFGVDGDHHLEKLAASHQRHRPRSLDASHSLGPGRLCIRFTLVVRQFAQTLFEVAQAVAPRGAAAPLSP